MPESQPWDLVIAGAGAAGILAAIRAAERGRRTLLLEKNRKPGVKILMSGGTRCNITHATDQQGIVAAFGKSGRFLHSALAALPPDDLVALIEAEGVPTKIEETGKIFPESDRASDVLAALMRRLKRSGCQLAFGEPVLKLQPIEGGFQVRTPGRVLKAGKIILTTGGRSYPGSGTTGDGYAWLEALGHTIVPLRPALTPITTSSAWVAPLRGVTVADVAVRVVEAGDPQTGLAAARGSFLFTHFGLSGPAVLDVSRAVSGHSRPQELALQCDFLPSRQADQIEDELRRTAATEGRRHVVSVAAGWLPRRLAETLVEQVGLVGRPVAEASRADRRRLIQAVKGTCIPVQGTRGFKKAEVTAGGVALDEVDSRTMQSKRVPNLYLAGEILDLDGPIGGYNFQAAFSEGWLAGEHV